MGLYIGLMSGTSMDGVDAVLCRIDAGQCTTLETASVPYPPAILARLHQLCQPADNELMQLGALDVEVARVHAQAVHAVLAQSGQPATAITAIGSHGQTVRHHPHHTVPFTLQIGDPNTLAVLTGITVVADFRRKDIALGGQGAPLVPAFHQAVFGADQARAIVNIGGIANVSLLGPAGVQGGYDTGPGNTLMDHWIYAHQQKRLDKDGAWAAAGQVDQVLLEALLADPYFAQPAPKSTGREYFNLPWLHTYLAALPHAIAPADIQATLCELTAVSIARAVQDCEQVYVCGGGAYNKALMQRLAAHMPGSVVASTAALGVDPQQVEGAAFAWLAWAYDHQVPGNVPAVTGAARAAVLGAKFYAG